MRRILDYHLNDRLHLRLTQSNDQLIEYDELLDFISRAQELYTKNFNIHPINGKKILIPSIPTVHSSYILPSITKPIISPLPTTKTSPVEPPSPIIVTSSSQSNNHQISQSSSSKLSSSLSIPPEFCPISLYNAKIDGDGWIQINNVYLPFIIKNHQRLVPYQVLVSCKILEPNELRSTLTPATKSDIILINSLIHNCKINNEQIPENTLLINIYHILIGTKNLVYVKILPKNNPTSKINRQYKSVLALNGGLLYITNRLIPFVCSNNRTYIPLNEILTIYPNLQRELKNLSRVPRTYELDYLQLVQIYTNKNELPLDTLLINIEDLNQRQIISSKTLTLIEYHAKEKIQFEQQINLLINKRKNHESHENKQPQQKFKLSTPSNQLHRPTGYFPVPSSHTQQNHWLSSNSGHRGKPRWQ